MLRPQVTVLTTPMVTLRNPAPGHVMLGQQLVQLKELQPGKDVNVITLLLHQSVGLLHVVLLGLKSLDCDVCFFQQFLLGRRFCLFLNKLVLQPLPRH